MCNGHYKPSRGVQGSEGEAQHPGYPSHLPNVLSASPSGTELLISHGK